MIYTQSTESIEKVEKLLPQLFRHKPYVPLSNHIWIQSAPLFSRLGLLSNQRCSKCGARLNCAGICNLPINQSQYIYKEN